MSVLGGLSSYWQRSLSISCQKLIWMAVSFLGELQISPCNFENFYLMLLLSVWCLICLTLTLFSLTVTLENKPLMFCQIKGRIATCPYRLGEEICSFSRLSTNPIFSPTLQFQKYLITSIPKSSRVLRLNWLVDYGLPPLQIF